MLHPPLRKDKIRIQLLLQRKSYLPSFLQRRPLSASGAQKTSARAATSSLHTTIPLSTSNYFHGCRIAPPWKRSLNVYARTHPAYGNIPSFGRRHAALMFLCSARLVAWRINWRRKCFLELGGMNSRPSARGWRLTATLYHLPRAGQHRQYRSI